ncbi:MAG: hypothetical protein JWQ98_1358 [Chlorobi bacterium]|nr:hypothetical protein [Chlorobiota bacterium]
MDIPNAITGTSATWNYTGARTIIIDHEDFRGEFSRPTRVRGGVVIIKPSPHRDTSLLPLSVQDDELWGNYKEGSFEGGHIIGLALGGPDHPCNIAPMSKGSNCGSGTWGQIEQQIRTIIGMNGGTASVDLVLSYDNNLDPRIPARVNGTIRGGFNATTVNTALRPPNDVTNILTPNIKGIFSDIKELAEDLNIEDTNPHARLDVVDRIRHQDQNIITRVQNIRTRLRRIPILATYPSGGIGPKQKKGRVLPVQRILMMLHNRYLNDGLLMAEDTYNLGLMLREWQTQADHIRPYARSKDSSYKNLRLLHHRTNNKRGARARGAGGQQKRVRKAPIRFTY